MEGASAVAEPEAPAQDEDGLPDVPGGAEPQDEDLQGKPKQDSEKPQDGGDPWDFDPALDSPPPDEEPQADEAPGVLLEAGDQLSLNVGGKEPTDASLRLAGGALKTTGSLKKGQTVELKVKATVTAVHLIDKRDPTTREVVATTRKHVAHIEEIGLV